MLGLHRFITTKIVTRMQYLHGFLCQTAFLECSEKLLVNEKRPEFDVHGARQVLARVSLSHPTLEMHARVLAALLSHSCEEKEPFYAEVDAELLSSFLHDICIGAVASTPLPELPQSEEDFPYVAFAAMDYYADAPEQGLEFIRVYMRTALQHEARESHKLFTRALVVEEPTPLDRVLGSLGQGLGAHPALSWAVEHALVEPSYVLNYLQGIAKPGDEPLNNRAYCAFMTALRPLVAGGAWKAQEASHCNGLWLGHERAQKEGVDRGFQWEVSFVREMVHGNPAQLHEALEYITRMPRISHAVLHEFFPLPLRVCNGREVLKRFAKLMMQDNLEPTMGTACVFLERMHTHHPEVMQLLRLHFSICPTYEDAACTSDAMVDAFKEICTGQRIASEVESIDSAVFT